MRVDNVRDVVTYAIVTIPSEYTRMTANLQGPLLINTRTNLGKQLVLVNSSYRIRHSLFPAPQPALKPSEVEDKIPVGV